MKQPIPKELVDKFVEHMNAYDNDSREYWANVHELEDGAKKFLLEHLPEMFHEYDYAALQYSILLRNTK